MNNFLNSETQEYHKHQPWQYVIWLLYLAGSLLLILNHELWKDEAHHWLLARDSESIPDLIHNGRYEGHPLLWNTLLFFVSRFTHNPLYVQLLHWSIGVASFWVLIFKSPFPKWVKAMLPFTYLFFYEYQAISRNYALCILMLFIICHLLNKDKVNYLHLSLPLILLANTHLFGLIIASGICLVILFHHVDFANRKLHLKPVLGFYIICLVGFLVSVYQIIPPSDHFLTTNHNSAGLLSGTRINKLLSVFYRGVFHMPNITQGDVWNSNLLFTYIPDVAKATISLGVWAIPFVFFRRHKRLVFLFFFSSLSIAFFAYISPLLLSVRHSGFVFVLLFCCLWLTESNVFKTAISPRPIRQFPKVIFGILCLNLISTLAISIVEINRPFSMSKEVVTYISDQKLDMLPLVSTQNSGPSLSAYLETPIYYLDKGDMGSYAIWSSDAFIQEKSVVEQNLRTYATSHKDFLIASEYAFDKDLLEDCWQIEPLQSFKGSIVRSEQFELYRVRELCD